MLSIFLAALLAPFMLQAECGVFELQSKKLNKTQQASSINCLYPTFLRIPGIPAAQEHRLQPIKVESTERCLHDPKTDPLFLELYQKYNLNNLVPAKQYIIPPIIHQIWVGPKSRARFESLRQSWIDKHPGWLYKLWTDEDVKKLKLVNQYYYDKSPNYGEKADILRYEVLYQFGGIYVDIDSQCLKPFDIFNLCYEFYAGLCDPTFICNGLIGATPGHPILKHCIKTIKNDFAQGVPYSTGPLHLTKSFKAKARKCKKPVIACPLEYFYPAVTQTLKMGDEIKAIIMPETFSVHGWAASWLP